MEGSISELSEQARNGEEGVGFGAALFSAIPLLPLFIFFKWRKMG
jgi:hypothetical protein